MSRRTREDETKARAKLVRLQAERLDAAGERNLVALCGLLGFFGLLAFLAALGRRR